MPSEPKKIPSSSTIAREAAARGHLVSAGRSWAAVVDGRFVLVGVVERDGVRSMVFRAAQPRIARREGLTTEEATALGAAARGIPLEEIATDLSTSRARAGRLVASGMKKLGITSLVELARLLGG